VNETRAQFTHSNLATPPSDLVGPAVSVSGVASFGRLSSSPTARVNKLYQIVDNVAYQTEMRLPRRSVLRRNGPSSGFMHWERRSEVLDVPLGVLLR
jgi:hypothetical protein